MDWSGAFETQPTTGKKAEVEGQMAEALESRRAAEGVEAVKTLCPVVADAHEGKQ
jgi:hypothetical protein